MRPSARLLAVVACATVLLVPTGLMTEALSPALSTSGHAAPTHGLLGTPSLGRSSPSGMGGADPSGATARIPNEDSATYGASLGCQHADRSGSSPGWLSPPGTSVPVTPAAGVDLSSSLSGPTAPSVSAIVHGAISHGVCANVIFPPRAPASSAQLAQARASGVVAPLFNGTPAPIGLADYGLRVDNGTTVAANLATTSLRADVDENATGIRPVDLYNAELGADAYAIQLNAVLTNVVLFGDPGFQFWTQNVFEYSPGSREAYLITNIWNFSGPTYRFNAIYSHGPNGVPYVYGIFYVSETAFSNVTYPFNLSLYLNSTLVSGRDAVLLGAVLSGPGESINTQFDYLVFNSTLPTTRPLSAPAEFSANSSGYDLMGVTNDFELDVGGPGGGSQATLLAADAGLGLAYWNGTAARYLPVPSALNYGGETAETATGATVTWSDAPGGPQGLSTYGVMTTGPAFLAGLWNASGAEGAYPVTIESSPSNAFEVFTPEMRSPWTSLTTSLLVAPGYRTHYQEAYDPALGAPILFGGLDTFNDIQYNDTWEFSAGRWTDLNVIGPPGRLGAGFVYDPALGGLVLFGGETIPSLASGFHLLNDTWLFNGSGWQQLHPARAPSPRVYSAVAYDAADAEIVLFSGGRGTGQTPWTVYNDTWTFRSGQWTNVSKAVGPAPMGRLEASAVYDEADGYVLLVGGKTSNYYPVACPYPYADEWTFSGGRWSPLAPAGRAPPPGEGTAWFDSATQTTYFYEGTENLTSEGGLCAALGGDVYGYSGGIWRLVAAADVPGAPVPRHAATIVDDQADHVELLFGGQQTANQSALGDTWLFNPNVTAPLVQPRFIPEPSVAVAVVTDTFWLAPGNYSLETELSGYTPLVTALNVTGPLTVPIALAPDPALGIYTPLWAWSDSQLAAISTSGTGVPSEPYVLENVQPGPIGQVFGVYNPFGYAAYAGILLLDTRASTEVVDPASFATETNAFSGPGPVFPELDTPPLCFWNVSGVALLDGKSIGANTTFFSSFAPFKVMFYDSSNNLIAENSFGGIFGDLLMEAGPTSAGEFAGPSGNNTIWGNTFEAGGAMGLVEVESNDRVYNNAFYSNQTACQPGNPLAANYCWPVFAPVPTLNNTWNISVQASSNVHLAPGFPLIPLTGSIIGTTWQGGNFWWNYGVYPNSYADFPYDDGLNSSLLITVYITGGGDYAPLTHAYLYTVTLEAVDLSQGNAWRGWVANSTTLLEEFGTLADNRTNTHVVYLPNGTYTCLAKPPNYLDLEPLNTTFVVSGGNLTVAFAFPILHYQVEFVAESIPVTYIWVYGWTIELNGTFERFHSRTVNFTEPSGVYPLVVSGPAGYQAHYLIGPPPEGLLHVTQNATVPIVLYPGKTPALTFAEKGLPKRTNWCTELDDEQQCSTSSTIVYANLTPSVYNYSVTSPAAGWNITGKVGHSLVILTNGAVQSWDLLKRTTVATRFIAHLYPVTFVETGLSAGRWSVKIDGFAISAAAGAPIVFSLPNGTYAYKVGARAGYHSSGVPSPVVVSGGPASVLVTFAKG